MDRRKERRRAARFKISQFIKLSLGRENFLQAVGVNLSESGISCAISEYVEPGNRVFLMFNTPQEPQGKPINCEGVVIWSDKRGDNYATGIAFTDMRPEDKNHLRSYLQTLDIDPE